MKKIIILGLIFLISLSPVKGFATETPLGGTTPLGETTPLGGTTPSGLEVNDLYNESYSLKAVFSELKSTKIPKEGVHNNYNVTDDDIYLMAQIVYAESRSEPFEGKVAVASVILNRLNHAAFPKSIKEVVTQRNAFSCVKNGKINVIPDESSYSAVREALKGSDPTSKAVFFYNPKIATSKWMKNVSKTNEKIIGNHVFFLVN